MTISFSGALPSAPFPATARCPGSYVGIPKTSATPNTASVGFTTKLVTISAITADGLTAICVDKGGIEVRVPMYIQRSKGALPEPGEQWIISQDIAMGWSFAAIATTTSGPFVNQAVTYAQAVYGDTPGAQLPGSIVGPPPPGSIPGSALVPGSVTGAEVAAQAISALNLAMAAAATNIILDPKFTSDPINLTRIADPGTAGTWVLASPAATASDAGLATLAMMPSTLVPLYVNAGEQYYLSVSVGLSGGSGVSAGIQFAFDDGSFLGPLLPVGPGANLVAQLVTIPPGVSSAYVRLIVSGLPSGATASFTRPVCYITIGTDQLRLNSVAASNIIANTIGVAQLQAGIVIAGVVDATVVTGATLQNHAAHPRTSINPDGSISITNSSGAVIFKIGADGTVDWYTSAGFLQMELQPGGTQVIYQSLTGPFGWDFEPPSAPAVLSEFTSNISSTTYVNGLAQDVRAGSVVTVIASASGATDATGVTDAAGNTYTLVRSVTTGQHLQVFQATNVAALASGAGLTVTFGAANGQEKNMIVVASSFVPTVTPLDFSQSASGTSTAPSVTGTPNFYGDLLLFIGSWATAGGAGTVPDGWQQASQVNVAGQHWTGIWYSMNITGAAVTASAAITSAAWAGVLLGYKASPTLPLSAGPVPTSATLTPSTQWADDGVFSCRVTKVGTASQWGITFPSFPVQPGAAMAARIVIGTLNVAMGAFEVGFRWWSGPNGTGSDLGTAYVTMGTIGFNHFAAQTIINCIPPPTAVSATFYALEKQADTAGNWFLIDNLSIPGGLAYSNSPVVTSDILGNQVDQGITFVGLPGLTNVFGVLDAYSGAQVAGIDGQGNISGQVLSAASDLLVAGNSLVDELNAAPQGIINRGWTPGSAASHWPSTPITAAQGEIALLEVDVTIPAGRRYALYVLPADFVTTTLPSSNTQYVQRLRYTTDGSTPTTSSAEISSHSPAITPVLSATILNYMTPYMEYLPAMPAVDTTYRVLLSASVGAGAAYQFANVLEMRWEDLGLDGGQFGNSGVVLGTGGSGGGNSAQTYTEYFYGHNTWSYNEFGLRNTSGTLYHGAYSGEGYAQHGWIEWSNGSLGNSLNGVLNFSVSKVTLRLLCQHTWYNSGMTVSLHSSPGNPGNLGVISGELAAFHANPGVFTLVTLSSSAWAPLKAAGRTLTVLRPPGGNTSLDYYGYFWGGGNNNANVPRIAVTYTV